VLLIMPLTFTAPIEQVPEAIVGAFRPPDARPSVEVPTTGYFPPPRIIEAGWKILNMTAEQAATLRRLAEATYEREVFQPNLTRDEADLRIAMLTAKLKLLGEPPHTL
jgi:hypothetical protein